MGPAFAGMTSLRFNQAPSAPRRQYRDRLNLETAPGRATSHRSSCWPVLPASLHARLCRPNPGQIHLGLGTLCRACAEYGLGGHLVSLAERVDNLMTCSDLFVISVISGPAFSVCPASTLPMVPATVTAPAPVTVEPNISCTSFAMLGSFPMAFWAAKVTVRMEANRIANLVIDEAPCAQFGRQPSP
jgi:hypothetical protein